MILTLFDDFGRRLEVSVMLDAASKQLDSLDAIRPSLLLWLLNAAVVVSTFERNLVILKRVIRLSFDVWSVELPGVNAGCVEG